MKGVMTKALLAFAGMAVLTPAAFAAVTFSINATGAQEAPTQGDGPNALATGTVMVDDTTDTISWNLHYSGLSGTGALTGFHIHGPLNPGQVSTGIKFGFVTSNAAVPEGDLVGQLSFPTLHNDILLLESSPERFYLNIHTTSFPSGAIRANLPEPASLTLLSLVPLGLLSRRRK